MLVRLRTTRGGKGPRFWFATKIYEHNRLINGPLQIVYVITRRLSRHPGSHDFPRDQRWACRNSGGLPFIKPEPPWLFRLRILCHPAL